MCRSLTEGGRRCPSDMHHQGYSHSRANQAARKQLSRARKKLKAARQSGDNVLVDQAAAQVASAQARVDSTKADTAATPAARHASAHQPATAPAQPPSGPSATPAAELTAAPARLGGEDNNLHTPQPSDPYDALQRVKDLGADAVSKEDLDAAVYCSDLTTELHREITAAQQRHHDRRVREHIEASTGLESRLHDAYQELSTKQQDWVSLAKLREKLGNPDKAEMDEILNTMTKTGLVHLAPDSNRKTLTADDHAAAIRIGKEDKHRLAIEPDYYDTVPPTSQPRPNLVAEPQNAVPATEANSREEAADLLRGLTKKELAQVAATYNQKLPSRMRKADQIDLLCQSIQDGRLARGLRPPNSASNTKNVQARIQDGSARRKQEKDAAARPHETKPAVVQVADPPVSGRPSDKPLLENTWGTGEDTPVSYHDDGPIGMAVKYMGADQRMSVDGEPLANVLGKLATDVNRRRRTPQEGLDAMKELRDRLPNDSRARQCLDSAVQQIDAPRGPAPAVPAGTPEPLRKLVHDLHDIPVVRSQPDREMEPLLRIIDDVVAGKARPMMVEMEIDRLRDRRHESYVDSGWRQIRDAVALARDGYKAHVSDQTGKQT